MYGQTEASPRISYLSPEYADTKVGTVGVPISCGQVCINETGEKSGTGELCYIGPNVALGYANNYTDLKLGDVFKGTLLTGDIVDIDSDGFIKIVGRNKRFIKITDISVNLDKIEKDLNESTELDQKLEDKGYIEIFKENYIDSYSGRFILLGVFVLLLFFMLIFNMFFSRK